MAALTRVDKRNSLHWRTPIWLIAWYALVTLVRRPNKDELAYRKSSHVSTMSRSTTAARSAGSANGLSESGTKSIIAVDNVGSLMRGGRIEASGSPNWAIRYLVQSFKILPF